MITVNFWSSQSFPLGHVYWYCIPAQQNVALQICLENFCSFYIQIGYTQQLRILCFPAPTGLPQSFTIIQRRARNMTFSWSPPAPTLRNGAITGYFLSCVPETGGRNTITMQYTAAGTFTLGGFTPAISYNCFISASNSLGRGPAAYLAIRTLDDCEYFFYMKIMCECFKTFTMQKFGCKNRILGMTHLNLSDFIWQCKRGDARITADMVALSKGSPWIAVTGYEIWGFLEVHMLQFGSAMHACVCVCRAMVCDTILGLASAMCACVHTCMEQKSL